MELCPLTRLIVMAQRVSLLRQIALVRHPRWNVQPPAVTVTVEINVPHFVRRSSFSGGESIGRKVCRQISTVLNVCTHCTGFYDMSSSRRERHARNSGIAVPYVSPKTQCLDQKLGCPIQHYLHGRGTGRISWPNGLVKCNVLIDHKFGPYGKNVITIQSNPAPLEEQTWSIQKFVCRRWRLHFTHTWVLIVSIVGRVLVEAKRHEQKST